MEKQLLEKAISQVAIHESLMNQNEAILRTLIDLELFKETTFTEFKELKKSIQPTIDTLNSLKNNLETVKEALENEK